MIVKKHEQEKISCIFYILEPHRKSLIL